MALDLFLHLDGIPGTSQNAKYTGQFEIASFSFDGKNPTTLTASGAGAGKVTLGPLIVTRLVDTASVALFLALCSGTRIANAILIATKEGAAGQVFLKYLLTEVNITEIATAPTPSAVPSESISLSFRTIQISVIPQNADGSAGTPIVGGWDLTKNTKL